MKKQIGKKIIIIMGLIFISTQFIYPLNTYGASKLNWDNPNQGKNPYKFKLSDYLNSQMAMQVVGCTGIVNKVSGTLANLMSGDVSDFKWIWAGRKAKIQERICVQARISLMTGLSGIPQVDPERAAESAAKFCHTQKTSNKETEKAMKDELKLEKGNQFRDECLNGIAYTLARNQLTAMTKQTMNWVTSGFNGDPMYVRNINNFLDSVEDEIIYQELNAIKNLDGSYNTRDYPYGKDFAGSLVRSRQSAENFAESSKQDLTNYLTDGATIEDFANDFSKGGWAGWLGLTQHPQNSPIGYTMIASQNVADKQTKETENIKAEKAENNGILSDKKCKVKAVTKKAGQIEIEKTRAANELAIAQANYEEAQILWSKAGTKDLKDKISYDVKSTYEKLLTAQQNANDLDASIEDLDEECAEWEVVTPGSLIGDKISYYLNSPERQLEIADSINEVLNVLFAQLINKLRLDGLSSLNSETFNNNSGGIGSNSWTTPINYTDVSGNKYAGSGLDENRAFDLTKDLGNIYNRSDVKQLGYWDASKNETTLMDKKKGLPLVPGRGEANTYYEVTVAGNTKLFIDGYNVWAVGDRAFFDGTTWQNWKKKENSPIAKRGIIQIQKDYIVVAKELQKTMPAVMPALGELDYCIPGPNPNWQANSGEAYEAFSEYVSGLQTVYSQKGDEGDRKENKERVDITNPSEDPSGQVFKSYRNIFKYNDFINKINLRWFNVEHTAIYSYIKVLSDSGHNNFDGDWVKEERMAQANDEVSELIQNIFDSLEIFDKEYPKTISETYGTMQQEYVTREDKIINPREDKNTAYLPMAKDGLTLTKKIVAYDEEIIDANDDLKDSINETESIINKLELIKNQVGQIIKTAQDRRDKTITEALNADPYNENYGTNYKAYKTKYAVCLDEENIDYLNYSDIVIDESNRCGDKVDNDFDGLIDGQDPDCKGERSPRTSGGDSTGSGGVGGTVSGSPYDNNSQSVKDYSQEANAY